MILRHAQLRRLRLPLHRPYRLSYRTFEEFEPFFVLLEDAEGRQGFADAHISPGSSSETREGGWAFIAAALEAHVGQGSERLAEALEARAAQSPAAATAIGAALEALRGHPALAQTAALSLPLLAPVNGMAAAEIAPELEERLAQGFRTFKVKVGKDVEADLARVSTIQALLDGRARLRLDANRAFSRADASRFVAGLAPDGIELFEQPCAAEDWDANAAVAAASPVPLMLDEPICSLGDIDRAAGVENVGFCKLKLKRFGGVEKLREGLARVRDGGMTPVLGDGLGSEIHNWMEACAARGFIDNAGEFNGFLKTKDRLFSEPMPFEEGAIRLPAGWRPTLDQAALDRLTVERLNFGG